MILKLLTAVIAVGVLAITYFYVDAQKDGTCPKSLLLKMIGATGYVAVGVLCIIITGEFSAFDKAMILALVASWLGDLFLHMNFNKILPAVGFVFFLTAHIFFIRAYVTGINSMTVYFPEKPFFSVPEIILIIVLIALFIWCIFKKQMDLKSILIVPIIIYGIVIITMLCKATILGIEALKFGITPLALVCSLTGALCFVASDFTISLLMFDKKQKKNFKLKLFNMYTYFVAEILLASLIYFI